MVDHFPGGTNLVEDFSGGRNSVEDFPVGRIFRWKIVIGPHHLLDRILQGEAVGGGAIFLYPLRSVGTLVTSNQNQS